MDLQVNKAALLNRKFRTPKVAITAEMLEAGKEAFNQMAADAENFSDESVCAGIFLEMWRVYWDQVNKVAKKKAFSPKLIIPGRP